jgi:hypothetical protein
MWEWRYDFVHSQPRHWKEPVKLSPVRTTVRAEQPGNLDSSLHSHTRSGPTQPPIPWIKEALSHSGTAVHVLLRLEMSGVIPPYCHMPSWHSQGLECYTFTRWRSAVSFTSRYLLDRMLGGSLVPGAARMLWRRKCLFSLPTTEPWFLGCPAYCRLTVVAQSTRGLCSK